MKRLLWWAVLAVTGVNGITFAQADPADSIEPPPTANSTASAPWATPPQAVSSEPGLGVESHAWMVVPESEDDWRLVHFPPRGVGSNAAKAGQVRPVVPLEQAPLALAAVGDRVYLLYQDEPTVEEPEQPLRVFSVRAVPVYGGYWNYEPTGRFASHPRLLAAGRFERAASAAGSFEVTFASPASAHRFTDDAWTRLETEPTAPIVPAGAVGGVHRFGAQRAWVEQDGATLIAKLDSGGQTMELLTLADTQPVVGVVPIRTASGRLVILTRDPELTGPGAYELIEVSLTTGEVWHRGQPLQVSPISPGEFRALVVSMVLFMVVVLLFTFRPGLGPEAVRLPANTALAEPGRRLIASLIDAVLLSMVVGAFVGVEFSSILTLAVLLDPGGGWIALPLMGLFGTVGFGLSEALTGATPGKLLTGCRVVALGEKPRRLPLLRAVLRNAVKWVFPPIAGLALLDPQTRHRGDDMARAVVIVPLQPVESREAEAGDKPESPEDSADSVASPDTSPDPKSGPPPGEDASDR